MSKNNRTFRGVTVFTFKDFVDEYGTSTNTVSKFYSKNKKLFVDGVDIFKLTKQHTFNNEPYIFKYTTKYNGLATRISPDELSLPTSAGPTYNVACTIKGTYLTKSGCDILLKVIQDYIKGNPDTKIHLNQMPSKNDSSISVANELVTHLVYDRIDKALGCKRPLPLLKDGIVQYLSQEDKDIADLYDTMAIDLLNKVHNEFIIINDNNIANVARFIKYN